MTHFVKLITANKQFYQWMEAGCDFVWKLYTRIPLCQRWFAQNPQKWEELFSWLDKNRTPPMYASHMPQFAQKGSVRLCKGRQSNLYNEKRFDNVQNHALYMYRANNLLKMKNGEQLNLSSEYDLDGHDCQNYKFRNGEQVLLVKDRFVPVLKKGVVMQDLDELVQIKMEEADGQVQTFWQMTHQGKLYPEDAVSGLFRVRELSRIAELVQRKFEEEARQREEQQRIRNEQAQSRGQQQNWKGNQWTYSNKPGDSDNDDDDDVEDDDDEMADGQLRSPLAATGEAAASGSPNWSREDPTDNNFENSQQDNYDNERS